MLGTKAFSFKGSVLILTQAALLKEDEAPFDENELACLAEEAGKEHPAEP